MTGRIRILILILGTLAVTTNHAQEEDSVWSDFPPGTVLIADGMYFDRTEITNVAWREYRHWVARIFGEGSEEFQNTLPDTGCWTMIDPQLKGFGTVYLTSPDYDHHPVVGVSQQQAKAYSDWRTDRVLEYKLIWSYGLSPDPKQTPKSYFSVKRYQNDELENFPKLDEEVMFPRYGLPSPSDWLMAVDNLSNRMEVQSEHIRGYEAEKVDRYDSLTRPSLLREGQRIIDLGGNVAEWSDIRGQALGTAWKDDTSSVDRLSVTKSTNAWTGFRNVTRMEVVK